MGYKMRGVMGTDRRRLVKRVDETRLGYVDMISKSRGMEQQKNDGLKKQLK